MKPPKPSATHARARVDADEGVRDCMRLMADGLWVTGISHADVAKRHGVSPATVKDWATSASRVLRLSLESDPENLRARLVTTLEKVVASAMDRDMPDLKVVVSAIDSQAKLLGLVVQRHEVTMSEDEAKAKWLEMTGQPWAEDAPS